MTEKNLLLLEGVHMAQHEYTGQKTTLWSRLSPSNLTRVLETKLGSSGLPEASSLA